MTTILQETIAQMRNAVAAAQQPVSVTVSSAPAQAVPDALPDTVYCPKHEVATVTWSGSNLGESFHDVATDQLQQHATDFNPTGENFVQVWEYSEHESEDTSKLTQAMRLYIYLPHIKQGVATKQLILITAQVHSSNDGAKLIFQCPAYKIILTSRGLYVYFLTDAGTSAYSRFVCCSFRTTITDHGVWWHMGQYEGNSAAQSAAYQSLENKFEVVSYDNPLTLTYFKLSKPVTSSGFVVHQLELRTGFPLDTERRDILGRVTYIGESSISPSNLAVMQSTEELSVAVDDLTYIMYPIYQTAGYDVYLTPEGLILWTHGATINTGDEIEFYGTIVLAPAHRLQGSVLSSSS